MLIERIPGTANSALRQHVLLRKPVIITGLFKRDPIGKIKTKEDALRSFGRLQVILQREYYSEFLKSGDLFRQSGRRATLKSFLDLLGRNPQSRLVVTEHPTLAELSSLMTIPRICEYRYGLDGSDGIASEMFVAGAGNSAHLHFDWDHRHVLLYQVFGQKRVSLISPEKSALLNPVLNMSQLNIELLSEPVKREFLGALSAYNDVLHPGETIYIPPLVWHCLEYIDCAMSISLRFGRTEYGRVFQERFHPNMHLQNIAWTILEQDKLRGKALAAYERIIRAYVTARKGGFRLYKRMQTVFEEIYRELCPNSIQETCWLPSTELVDRQVKLGLAAGVLYPQSSLRRR